MDAKKVQDNNNTETIVFNDFDKPGHQSRRHFLIPEEFKTIFSIIRNKYDLKNKEEIKQWIDWFHSYSQLPDHKYNKILGTVAYTGYCFPTCKDFKRYEMVVGIFLQFFIIDDHVDNDPDNCELHSNQAMVTLDYFEKCVQKLTSDEFIPIVGWPLYVTAFYAVFENICSKYNRNQKERFVRLWLQYIEGNREEVIAIQGNIKVENIDQLLEIRIKSVGVRPTAQLVEYTEDICVTDEEWNDQEFQNWLLMMCKVIIYTNDVFSFEKEYVQQKGDFHKMFNSVGVTVVQDDCSIEMAMNKIIEMTTTLEVEVMEKMNAMLANNFYRDEMKSLIQGMQYIISGNYWCSKVCDRYIKFNE